MADEKRSLPFAMARTLDRICDHFEAALQEGRRTTIEEHLNQVAEVQRDALLRALLAVEVELLARRGEVPELQGYQERFPEDNAVISEVYQESLKRAGLSDSEAFPAQSYHSLPPGTTETVSIREPGGSTSRRSPDEANDDEAELGPEFGRFRILKRLGKGGFGFVYLAHDPHLDRKIAVKVPRAKIASSREEVERFLREARTAGLLQHPNICPVHEIGEHDGRPYIVMAFIDGKPLSSFVKPNKPLPERQAAILIRKVALTLEAAHRNDIIHRDLKPQNIMIDRDRREPVVMDFGLARREIAGEAQLTQTGMAMGTPKYAPPEQIRGDQAAIGPASDIYSLGVTLYELLCGRCPFVGSINEIVGAVLHTTPDPPSAHRSGLDPRLEAICLKMMSRLIEDRYDSMAEVAAELQSWLKEESSAPGPAAVMTTVAPGRSRRPPPIARSLLLWGSLGGVIALLLGIVITVKHPDGTETRIETDSDRAKVTVDGNQIQVDAGPPTAAVDTTQGPHQSAYNQEKQYVDREAAEWALSLPHNANVPPVGLRIVGSTGVDAGRRFDTLDDLPSEPFRVTKLELLFSRQVRAEDVARLIEPLSDLSFLRLRGSEAISSAVIDVVSQMEQLTFLGLSDAGPIIADDEVARLGSLKQLTYLNLGGSRLTDDGLEHLQSLQNLNTLWIHDTQVTDAGMSRLLHLPGLSLVAVNGTRVGDEGVRQLVQLPALNDLQLRNCAVTDASLPEIAKAASLKVLNLSGTQVTDRGIQHLAALKNLRILHLARTEVSHEAAESLRTSLPELQTLTVEDAVSNSMIAEPDVTRDDLSGRPLDEPGGNTATDDVNDSTANLMSRLQSMEAIVKSEGGKIVQITIHRDRKLDEAMLARLKGLKHLRVLEVLAAGDTGLRHLAELNSLERLVLNGTPVSDEGLAHLANLTRLRTLYLWDSQITDQGLQHLTRLKELEHIEVAGRIRGHGLQHLSELSNLKNISLWGTPLEDHGLAHLRPLSRLNRLNLSFTQITDAGLEQISNLPELEQLNVEGTRAGDAGLSSLHSTGTLRRIDFRKTDVTAEGVAAFKAANPNCEVVWDGDNTKGAGKQIDN